MLRPLNQLFYAASCSHQPTTPFYDGTARKLSFNHCVSYKYFLSDPSYAYLGSYVSYQVLRLHLTTWLVYATHVHNISTTYTSPSPSYHPPTSSKGYIQDMRSKAGTGYRVLRTKTDKKKEKKKKRSKCLHLSLFSSSLVPCIARQCMQRFLPADATVPHPDTQIWTEARDILAM